MPIDVSKMNMPELLQHVSELPAKDRAPALKAISNLIPTLKTILLYTYHKNVKFQLPEGVPPYRQMETPENMGHNRLPREMRKFEYFLPQTNINQIKREQIFIEMLESLDPEEAKLVLMIKDKKIAYKGITRKLVEEALPEIFVGEQ
jgi:hypothetical protein